MQLYLLRHGPALSRSEWDRDDRLRPLSSHGRDVVSEVAQRIAVLDLGLRMILTSPCERALRTAVMVQEALEETQVVEEPRLEPGRFTVDSLAEMLRPYEGETAVMLVGHEPSMTEVLSDVVGGGTFVLRKGGLVRVELDEPGAGRGALKWFAPPRLLRV